MKQCLILVDIQNDYFPGGKMEVVEMEKAAENSQTLLDKFRNEGAPLFHIKHISRRPGATFFLPETDGAKIHDIVSPEEGETVIEKNFPNSFRETDLLSNLKENGTEELVICGAMSHMCIDATTRAAFDFGFRCVVINDACATRDMIYNGEIIEAASVHAAFMAALAVPYAKVISTIEYMA
ncbi:MAG: cysteine hydrolase [Deltaproteobacteria bacterium]|nr:cysteine hydrolase [Deltaproteobacteria bacterium]MBW2119481.1 cysteine hydrolase [Deltaproteobacteria bacterium]MBW2343309.1 cysteine hydrolase [Deltaproteobacteria bacterium]